MRKYTIRDFERDFPNYDSCLEWLKGYLYPNGITCKLCGEVTKHHRVKSRPSYSCDRCGHHVHPMAGTIYQDTRTPLKLWFYATFMLASTRCGISAKQLEREIGVTYKTAYRMFKQIRTLLNENISDLGGTVEVDETYVGGRPRIRNTQKRGRGTKKVPVLGMVERQGRVVAVTVPNVKKATLFPHVTERILPRSTIYTDELPTYKGLPRAGYYHRRIAHQERIYVSGDVHTSTIEGFWSLVKRGIGGVYHAVSAKHLQSYLNEYSFRYNHRDDETPMFQTMLGLVSR
jgi:transposase-like protein